MKVPNFLFGFQLVEKVDYCLWKPWFPHIIEAMLNHRNAAVTHLHSRPFLRYSHIQNTVLFRWVHWSWSESATGWNLIGAGRATDSHILPVCALSRGGRGGLSAAKPGVLSDFLHSFLASAPERLMFWCWCVPRRAGSTRQVPPPDFIRKREQSAFFQIFTAEIKQGKDLEENAKQDQM